MKTVWLNDWNSVRETFNDKHELDSMLEDFEIKEEVVEGCEILLASYTYKDYSGEAFVLFRKDGKLYEVNGGHCSCYGLEAQWQPEDTTLETLIHRLDNGKLGMDWENNSFANELREVIAELKQKFKLKEEGK